MELTTTSNVNIDHLVKSIITDKNDGISDPQLMDKVKEYEKSVMDVEDSKRLLRTLEERRRRRELNSSILQTNRLEKIAHQLASPQFKKTSGAPTSIAVCTKYIAIGTSHGMTMVFDHFETLKCVLGTTDGVEYGRVYTVAVSPDSEWVAVGHHLGQIVIWDLNSSKLVKLITNDAPLTMENRGMVPVITLEFVEGKRTRIMALSLDGVLNIHTLTRVFLMTMLDTNYILSGTSGTGSVLAVSALPPGSGAGASHPVDAFNLIACATFKRIVVFPSADKSSVIYHLKRPDGGREGSLPYLAWRELVSSSPKTGKTKLLDPVLAVGWGNSIVLVQILQSLVDAHGIATDPTDVSSLVFKRVASFRTDTEITSVNWLGTGVLVYTNTADELRVLDPFSIEEIEIDHIKHMELAYHTKLSREPGPGFSVVNASEAPAAAFTGSPKPRTKTPSIPQEIIDKQRSTLVGKIPAVTRRDQTFSQSYHASICTYRGKLFMVGLKSPFVTIVLGWAERINAIVEKGRWLDALALTLDFYHGRAKAVKGLPRDPVRAAAKIGARIEQLLYEYVKTNLAIPIPKDPSHFDIVATVCIDYCLILGRLDILFQLLHPLFQQRKKSGLLLEKLEPFILGDKLASLPPEVIQQIVKHYVSQPHLIPKLEQILLHLDIALLDFHTIVNLCIKHHLSTALFHLYIDGLNDFITPMDHLMKVLVKDLDLGNQFQATPEMRELKATIGLKIILYLQYIFKGKSFPSEKRLPARQVDDLREAIFEYLLVPKIASLEGERYPRLRVLLAADSHELLHVLRIALDGMSNPARLVQITDILVTLMVDRGQGGQLKQNTLSWSDKPSLSWPFSPSQVSELYYFISHYYSSGALDISDDLLLRIVSFSLLSSDSHPDKRERLLLDLLRACPEDKLDYQKLALLAESAKFYKVCDFFFTHRRDYGAVIRCHILDPDYRKSIFSFVRALMTSSDPSAHSGSANNKAPSTGTSSSSNKADASLPSASENAPKFVEYMLTEKEKEDVRRTCIERIADLIRIDNERTSYLLTNVLKCDQTQTMAMLNTQPEIQLAYLKACLQIGIEARNNAQADSNDYQPSNGARRASRGVADLNKPPLDLAAGEKLLELMCRFEPKNVVAWLRDNESVYRLDAAIQITKHFEILPAYCLLQETAGDMKEVLSIMLEPVKRGLFKLYESTKDTQAVPPFGTNGVLDSQEDEEAIQEHLDEIVAFCRRNHKRMEAQESQQLWFEVLDQVMHPLGEVEARLLGKHIKTPISYPVEAPQYGKSQTDAKKSVFFERPPTDLELLKYHLNKLMSRVLDSMIGYVDLQSILEKILNDRVDSKVSDFRDIFTRLLENYSHESNILGAAVEVLKYDTHQNFSELVARKKSGINGRNLTVQNISALSQEPDLPASGSAENRLYAEEPSRLQLLRDIDTGAIRKNAHPSEAHMQRETLAAMRNVQLQPTVPGAMPSYSLFHSKVQLDE